ncbi:MAG: acyl-CoA thioesterase [Candidatus Marinimicrobia bacterium]|nr:acyl-CoA thioesterase [Candidatus Neomarinimicrobiota bacterium]MBL7109008.1 acyl-CoA thioesterase [Candidatus Neomarinimicrobiota bacterium]
MYKFNKKVGFSEVDAAGVMFFARAFELFHIAYEDFMAKINLDLHKMFLEKGTALPVVHTEADYKKSIKLGETVIISLEILDIETRSYTIAYKIFGEDETLRVKGITKHVFVDASFKSASLPKEMKRILLTQKGEK